MIGSCLTCVQEKPDRQKIREEAAETRDPRTDEQKAHQREEPDTKSRESETKLTFHERMLKNHEEYKTKDGSRLRPIEESVKNNFYSGWITKELTFRQGKYEALEFIDENEKAAIGVDVVLEAYFPAFPGTSMWNFRNDFLLSCLNFAIETHESKKYDFKRYACHVYSPHRKYTDKYHFEIVNDAITMDFYFTEALLDNIDIDDLRSISQEDPELLELEVYRAIKTVEGAGYYFAPHFYEEEERKNIEAAKKEVRQEIRRDTRKKRLKKINQIMA